MDINPPSLPARELNSGALSRRTLLACFSALAGACAGGAGWTPQMGRVTQVDDLLLGEMSSRGIPGLQYTIQRDEQTIAQGALGFANIEHHVPASQTTLFQINSITKAFGGVAVMQLAEKGVLELDAPLGAYLPDLPALWSGVTLRRCLTHTSGLPQVTDSNGDLIAPTFEEAWTIALKAPVESRPGTRFSYNQANYVLLGRVIERASGKPFTTVIDEGQFKPAGMPLTARAGFVDANDIVLDAARVYTFERRNGPQIRLSKELGNNPFFEEFAPPLRLAAGLYSTSEEIARWLTALRTGRLLRPESLRALWTPGILEGGAIEGFGGALNGYALGWPMIRRTSHPAVGAVGGGRSAFFYYPDDKITVIVLTNLRGARPESLCEEVAGGLWS